ncbi:MBL fold metallo-hydrolase [Roseomonas elaeocarpi]|uniref:MBL fold metallo-hydrolase n=1 Tax=Roseomonas elaeocarpi TaxID=907779 RepID=A0ABV6JYJ8_9PROT
MRPPLQASLVNGRFGDPSLFVEAPLSGRALLLDLGELHRLPAAALLRVDAALVTHAHMDHLIGFDTLLRYLVGREKRLPLLGPPGIIERIGHKLLGYAWDLAGLYEAALEFEVTELDADGARRHARFRLATGFRAEPLAAEAAPADGVALRLPGLAVRAATLEHHGVACLGYRLEEDATANVSRVAIEQAGLRPGPWINGLKRALLEGLPDSHPLPLGDGESRPLGELRSLATVSPGFRLAYCTDLADTPANRAAVEALARDADLLFLESAFAAADAAVASRRGHLTTRAAGEIARAAGALRLEPFHFSARYRGEEARMLAEVAAAFTAGGENPTGWLASTAPGR